MVKPCVNQNWDMCFCVMVSSISILLQTPFNNGVMVLHNSLWGFCITERCVCDTSAVKFNSLLNTVEANLCALGVLPKLTFSEIFGSLLKSICFTVCTWMNCWCFPSSIRCRDMGYQGHMFGLGGASLTSCALEKFRIVKACEVFFLTKMFCIVLKTDLVTDSNCSFFVFLMRLWDLLLLVHIKMTWLLKYSCRVTDGFSVMTVL